MRWAWAESNSGESSFRFPVGGDDSIQLRLNGRGMFGAVLVLQLDPKF
jgi:hypothetical protein